MAYRSMLTEGWYDSASYPRDGTCFPNAEMSVQRVGSIIGYFMIYVARTDVKNAVSIILGGMALRGFTTGTRIMPVCCRRNGLVVCAFLDWRPRENYSARAT